ncbi:MAG: DNA mismatch repair protein MutS [Flavobacteriales bacterium]|nr:DNA mismatch repair protein MutS [Flavobacteriales bacterium]
MVKSEPQSRPVRGLVGFDDQTVNDLEFSAIRSGLEAHCSSEAAKRRALTLEPTAHRPTVLAALESTDELRRIRVEGYTFPSLVFEEIRGEIKLLEVSGSALTEAGFMRVLQCTRLVNDIVGALHGRERAFPRLCGMLGTVSENKEIVKEIEAVFDPKGGVRSNASDELARIRINMQTARRQVNRLFDKAMRACTKQGWLADTAEGYINERRVLAVASTHKRKVRGSAMGTSKTGSVTFIEPADCHQVNHELEMLRDDERREIVRILRELTQRIRKHTPLIKAQQRLLVQLDFIQAKVKLALSMDAAKPNLVKDLRVDLLKAHHPLLLLAHRNKGLPVEPQNLTLHQGRRVLVISGPNAGGKSITLKMVGLLQAMVQSGLLVPVHPDSAFGLFKQILTDIGDNQSIENQLSTYSYRLNRMKGFLASAGRNSMLLLDEFGTGSDPELGGALAEVFFEELYDKGVFGVITTHYANIKTRATQMTEAINGSMLFDAETLSPTYHLDLGQPGSSFTFEVAELNGIPEALIGRAKQKLDPRKVQLDGLIASLQKEKTRHAKMTDRKLKAEHEAAEAKRAYESRAEKLEERQESVQRVGQDQNSALVRGKKLQQFIDRFKSGQANKTLLEDVRKYLSVEATKQAEKAQAAAQKKAAAQQRKKSRRTEQHTDKIAVGSTVRLKDGRQRGEVLTLKGKKATVAFGEFRTRVEIDDLVWIR